MGSVITKKGVSISQVFTEIDLMLECAGTAQVVQLHDFIETPTTFFLIMEYCDGVSLEQSNEGVLGEKQAVRIIKQILKGLSFLHSTQICHRDIKPQNVMMVGSATSEH